jgi:small nuclear ribonucleoprotein (snRNP)-like protein
MTLKKHWNSQLPLSLLKTAQNHPMVRMNSTRLKFLWYFTLTLFLESCEFLTVVHVNMVIGFCGTNMKPHPFDFLLMLLPYAPQLVELKNGETYNGHLVSCDNWMNINLREVICTSRVKGFSISTCRHSRVVTTDLKYVYGCLRDSREWRGYIAVFFTNQLSEKCPCLATRWHYWQSKDSAFKSTSTKTNAEILP